MTAATRGSPRPRQERASAATARAPGSSSAKIARSASVPTLTRMHRSSGATPGMRTNTSRATRAASTRRA